MKSLTETILDDNVVGHANKNAKEYLERKKQINDFLDDYAKLVNAITLPRVKNVPASTDLFGNPLKEGDYVLIPTKENPYIRLGIIAKLCAKKPILVVKTIDSNWTGYIKSGNVNYIDKLKKMLTDNENGDSERYLGPNRTIEDYGWTFGDPTVFGANSQVDPSNCIKINLSDIKKL